MTGNGDLLGAPSPTLGAMCQILGVSGLRVDPNGRHLNLQVRLKLEVDGQRPRNAKVETIIANGLWKRAIKAA